jgi:hypothetical protein
MAITQNGAVGVSADAPATLSNKTLASPIFTGQITGLELAFAQSIVFEGTTADDFETTLSAGDPTADRTITLPDATGTVALTSDITLTETSTSTLSNKTLTAPKFVDLGFIADANGNELIILDTVASAVNEVTLANAATLGTPTLTASGTDTDISLDLVPKGTGRVKAGGVDLVTISSADTLTNKTLTSPIISSISNTGTITIPTTTGTLALQSDLSNLEVAVIMSAF